MCSLYSINNSSKFAGQSSFQVVLCAKGSDNNSSNQRYTSSSSPGSAWSASCSHSKRKKMKGGLASAVAVSDKRPVLVLSSSKDLSQPSHFNPPSFQAQDNNRTSNSPHYPPLSRATSTQPYQHSQQQQRRRGHSSHGTTHWQQFHQHNHYHRSFDASFDHDLGEHRLDQARPVHRQKRASWSSESHNSASRDAENRRFSQILNPTSSVQFHSKTLSTSQSTPTLSSNCNSSLLSTQRSLVCAPVATGTIVTSRPADTTVITFAAAVAAATPPSMSSPRSSLSSMFQPKQTCAATESLSSPVSDAAAVVVSVVDAQPEHPSKNVILYSVNPSISSEEIDDLSSPMGTSVDSNTNDVFDADEMELQHSNDLDSLMTGVETSPYPLPMHVARRPIIDPSLKLERKSRLRRKVDRLQAKNAALKSTVTQAKSDLALERQRRSNMDQIYSNIRKDLSQKLENEEIKVLNLKAEMEQMAAEMKKLKNQLATAKARASAGGKGSSMGYKIGYDSSAFSLSSGISNVGGLMLHHSNLAMISGQDDSEEFLLSHSYSSATIRNSPSLSTNPSIAAMSCSDNEDEGMDDDGQSDDDDGTLLFTQNAKSSTPSSSRRASISSVSSLLTLVEEESEEQSEDDDSDDEHDDAPCTMMEIILQRQQTRSPEDNMENPPADADETFETMAQNALFHAIQSKSTVGQAHLQLEELVLKYNARLEQAVDVIAKEVSRWWEDERLATGGPISGGWGTENVVINKETGELANPKISVEKRMESFFGPLLLQFVASLAEQKMLLEKLGNYARADGRWLKNHNAMLVALYKFDVVEADAVLEWWKALEEPQGVFGHGGNNLRSLNSRFVAWLEDEEDDSESDGDDEEDGSDIDGCSDSDDSDDDSEEDDSDDDDMEQDDDVVNAILDVAYPPTSTKEDTSMANESNSNGDQESESSPRPSGDDNADVAAGPTKRRISFCTNNLYYSYDGRICRKKDLSVGENGEQQENANKKKYQQCPPFRAPGSEASASDVESATEEDRSD